MTELIGGTELMGKETVDNWTPIVTTWAIHTYILGDGRVTVLKFGSTSDYIAVQPGYQIRNDGPATGRNDETLNMYVHEYTGTTWKKRTQLRPNGGSICTISDGTDYVRLTFAYSSDSGMTLSQEDIETYAKPKQLGSECMTELMRRRRALMAQASTPQGDTVPGKLVTIPVSITQSSEINGVVQQLVSNYSINCPGIMLTTKKIRNLRENEFVAVVITTTGGADMAMRWHGNNIEVPSNWSSTEYYYYCDAGTRFYVLETQPSANSIQLPGYIVPLTGSITNGQNLSTTAQESMQQKGVSKYSIMMTAKEKSTWVDRQFVCSINGLNALPYSSTNYGPFRWEASLNKIAKQNTTSTYDFKASAGDIYYVVEMKP